MKIVTLSSKKKRSIFNSFLSRFGGKGKRSRSLTMISSFYEGLYMKYKVNFVPTTFHIKSKLYSLVYTREVFKKRGKKFDTVVVPILIAPERRTTAIVRCIKSGIDLYTPAAKKNVAMASKLIEEASVLLKNENSKSQVFRDSELKLAIANRANLRAFIS